VEIGANEFVRFYETNLRARRQESYSPLDIVTRLTEEAISRGQARVIAARPKAPSNASGNESLSVPY
jgi:hypothetical protein